MASNRITEGVGKKIVEALKQQSDIEIQNVIDNPAPVEEPKAEEVHNDEIEFTTPEDDMVPDYNQDSNIQIEEQHPEINTFASAAPNMMTFSQPLQAQRDAFASDLEGFEIPANIAVLKQLINQLPAGVSRQTGAQIIKQTMEALGISMKSVLQEAQQVQEGLNNSARECQASIMEYKKQINVLEKQSQKFQRQYSALNDIISLFIQTSL